jgi:hypothetical protein
VHGSVRRDTLRLMEHPNHSEVMRRILRVLDEDVEKSAAVYAVLEETGLLPRGSNVESWSPLTYARSLAQNEMRKHPKLVKAALYPC